MMAPHDEVSQLNPSDQYGNALVRRVLMPSYLLPPTYGDPSKGPPQLGHDQYEPVLASAPQDEQEQRYQRRSRFSKRQGPRRIIAAEPDGLLDDLLGGSTTTTAGDGVTQPTSTPEPDQPDPENPAPTSPADNPEATTTDASIPTSVPVAQTTAPGTAPTAVAPAPNRPPVGPPVAVGTTPVAPPAPTATSDSSKSSASSSNTGATVGIIVAALIVAAIIGVWVFRKWMLSPSRKFKSKLSGNPSDSEFGATAGAGAIAGAGVYGHATSDYTTSYDNMYANQPPMEAITSGGPSALAAPAMGYQQQQQQQQQQQYQYDNSQQYDYGYGDSYQQADGQYYQGDYNNQYPQQDYQDYNQFQQVPLTPATAKGGELPEPKAAASSTGAASYASDFQKNDHFLRELRE
ncbi:hypothetical protein BGX34_002751 [Mortierella sp. NVP85]|nr:hypothetical protein BGX34_002751 [Mortierella sp. NVP85]